MLDVYILVSRVVDTSTALYNPDDGFQNSSECQVHKFDQFIDHINSQDEPLEGAIENESRVPAKSPNVKDLIQFQTRNSKISENIKSAKMFIFDQITLELIQTKFERRGTQS